VVNPKKKGAKDETTCASDTGISLEDLLRAKRDSKAEGPTRKKDQT